MHSAQCAAPSATGSAQLRQRGTGGAKRATQASQTGRDGQLAQTAQRRLPGEPNVADTLGWVYYQKGMTTAAVRELEAAARINAKDPIVHYHLGKAYNKAGYIEKAKASLELALKLDPNFADAADARQTLGIIGG